MSKFLDKTGLDTLWAKIKSTFQTLGNLVTAWGSTPSDTKYPSEKLVKESLDGKLPKTTNASEIISSAYPQCFYSKSYYSAGYVLFYDVTSAFDGTFASITSDQAHVAFSGFVQSAKYNGYGEPQFYKVEGKVNGKYPINYNASTSKTYGPVVLKRTYEEEGVTKQRYYFAIKVPENYNYGIMFFGVFHASRQSGTSLSWDSGFLGNLVLSTDTEYSVHWSWTAGYNVAAEADIAKAYDTAFTGTNSIKTAFDGKVDYSFLNNASVIGNSAPAADCIAYYESSSMPNNRIKMLYNVPGNEATIIFSKRASYGSILKYGYADKYIYILRKQNSTWRSNNWEKISAGTADTASAAAAGSSLESSINGKADDSAVVHKAGEENITGNKVFKNGVEFFSASGSSGYGIFVLPDAGPGTSYSNWDSSLKDEAHFREWTLHFPAGVNFWGRIRITFIGGYNSYNASGSISKTILCAFNGSTIFNNTGSYDALGINTENEFRISDLIWDNTNGYWTIKIHSIKPKSDNSVVALRIEFGCRSDFISVARQITWSSTTPSIVTDTTYYTKRSGNAATDPTSGGVLFNWADKPVFQSPYGYQIFDKSHTIHIDNGGTGGTTQKAAEYNICNPDEVSVTPSDDSYVIFNRQSTASTANGRFKKLKLSYVWNYIKGKISSVLGLTETSYDGNAATATTATTAAGYTSGGAIDAALQGKVDKETGKGLSTNDYTTTEKNKLAGIASGAEVNVQSDWNQTTSTADDYIKNKPSLATVATSGSYSDLSGKPDTIEWATYGTTTYDQVTAMLAAGNLPCARYGNEVFKYYMYASRSYKFMSENMTYVSVDESDVWSYGNDYPTPATIGAVPTSRTVNGKALSSDVTLSASDVGAAPAGTKTTSGNSNVAWCIKVTRLSTSGIGYARITVDLERQTDTDDFGFVDVCVKTHTTDWHAFAVANCRRNAAKQFGQCRYQAINFGSVDGVLYIGVTCSSFVSNVVATITGDYADGQFSIETGDYSAVVGSNWGNALQTRFQVFANYNGNDMAAIGSSTQPVYLDANGQVVAGKDRIQAVNALNTSTMDSEVLYVL